MSAQEKAVQGPAAAATSAVPSAAGSAGKRTLGTGGPDGLAGSGLPYRQRSLFEASLGRDLSNVRVHTDDAAAEQADAVDARAFAVGDDIHFAKGQYKPGTPEGDQLLAHEVAHTVQQQGAAPAADVKTTTPGDGAEKNADSAASAMMRGSPAEVTREPIAIARKANHEEVAPAEAPAGDGPASTGEGAAGEGEGPATAADAKAGEGPEEIGELSVERVGVEEDEGEDQPVGPPQNLEGAKADLAAKGEALPADGGAGALKDVAKDTGGGGSGGGGGGEAPISEELQASVELAQADARAGAEEAKAEAEAYKAEINARRDKFDAEQQAMTLEQLKTMSPADKRSSLIEMGYDQKSVKKMKDAELDGIISGRIETEQRKTRILGMDDKERAGLSAERKAQFLVDLGVEKKDIDKIGPQKAAAAFDDVMRVANVPGQHKVKVKIKGGLLGKSWEINVKVDGQGNPEFEAKKKGGFLSKLWGWVKLALPVIAVILAPVTAGASLIALAVYQTVTAIAAGDWMGALIGAAGAFVGIGALAAVAKGTSAAAKAFKSIADVAGKVKGVAEAARAAAMAAKAKNPGGILAALAAGASGFAKFAEDAAGKFATTMNRWADRLEKWSTVINGGQAVVAGIKAGDPGAALAGAFSSAAALTSKKDATTGEETSAKAKTFEKYGRIAGFASAGQRAAKGSPPDYGSIAVNALNIAAELETNNEKYKDAAKITAAANRLQKAIVKNDPSELAAAAIGLAEAIQVAKLDELDEKGEQKADARDDKAAIQKRYQTASTVVRAASAAIKAVAAKPRPDYAGARDAALELVAELTESKTADRAADITAKFDAWTRAIQSKNEQAIFEAAQAFGEAIGGIRDELNAEKEAAKKAAEAKLAPGETLPEEGGEVPPAPTVEAPLGLLPSRPINGLVELPGTIAPNPPGLGTESESEGTQGEGEEALSQSAPVTPRTPTTGREATPNANYTVVPGDTLSGIAQRFKVTTDRLRTLNPQLVNDKIYLGQRLIVPGAEIQLRGTVTTTEQFSIDQATLDSADLAQLKRMAYGFVTNQRGIISNWRDTGSTGGLGAFFYNLVDQHEDKVDSFDRALDSPTITADRIRSGIRYINEAAKTPQKLFDDHLGLRNRVLGGSIVVAGAIKDGAGALISVLDPTPGKIINTAYSAIVGAVDAWADGASPGMVALKAASSVFFDRISPLEADGYARRIFNNAFKTVGNGLVDLGVSLDKPNMTEKEKQAAVVRAAMKVSLGLANSLPATGIEMNEGLLKDLEKHLINAGMELWNFTSGKMIAAYK